VPGQLFGRGQNFENFGPRSTFRRKSFTFSRFPQEKRFTFSRFRVIR